MWWILWCWWTGAPKVEFARDPGMRTWFYSIDSVWRFGWFSTKSEARRAAREELMAQ